MALDPQEKLLLVDNAARRLGSVAIQRIERDRVYGVFLANHAFDAVKSLFDRLEVAANDQLFHEVDRISDEIGCLGLRLTVDDGSDSLRLEDVQIMGGADISFYVPHLQLTQLASAAAEA